MAIRQVYLKRIVAYASIAHMNGAIIGVFTQNVYAITCSLILMFAHGVTSSGLFFLIVVLYDRYHTRLLKYYSGLVVTMPLFVIMMFIFSAANFSLPGTFNFVG
jgi:NADH:ubiquinone oxidoreductase subunit 4 (subunit M)